METCINNVTGRGVQNSEKMGHCNYRVNIYERSKKYNLCPISFLEKYSYIKNRRGVKTNEILDKSRAEFCLIFRSFFGQWSFKYKCF